MRIVFNNIVFSFVNSAGISIVWSELIKKALSQSFESYFIELKENKNNLFRKNLPIPESKIIVDKRPLWYCRLTNPTIPITKNFILATSGYEVIKRNNVANVVIIHDFINEILGKKILPKLYHTFMKRRAIKHADAVVCVSQSTRKDLFKLYPFIEKEKVHVISNGVSSDFYIVKELNKSYKLPYRQFSYIIFVGRRPSYKNFDKIIDALYTNKELKFIIIGGGSLNDTEIRNLDTKLGNENYIHLKNVPTQELNYLYNNAFALVYPSIYEGFGLPVLEAQRAGCPVITTKFSSLPEVTGDGAILLDEVSDININNALLLLKKGEYREELIRKGINNSLKYSWDKMAEEYFNVYTSVWEKRFTDSLSN